MIFTDLPRYGYNNEERVDGGEQGWGHWADVSELSEGDATERRPDDDGEWKEREDHRDYELKKKIQNMFW